MRPRATHACGLVLVTLATLAASSCGAQSGQPPLGPGEVPVPITPEQSQWLISSYWQDAKTNCTSVAFTKAVLAKFGSAARAFAQFRQEPGSITVTTRSGTEIRVSDQEVEKAGRDIGIQHDNSPTYQQAVILFALLAKACQNNCIASRDLCTPQPDLPCDTFDHAVAFLNDSLKWNTPPALMGMREGIDYVNLEGSKPSRWIHVTGFVRGGGACVAATPWHTYFVASGYYDRFGKAVRFNHHSSKLGLEALHAYCLGDAVLDVSPSVTQVDAEQEKHDRQQEGSM